MTATLDFGEAGGGGAGGDRTTTLELPFRAGMDGIQMTSAALQLRARGKLLEADYQASNAAGGGVIVWFATPRRLRKIQVRYADPPPAVGKVRVVVRAVAGAPGAFQPGPPIFAAPAFGAPGPMFGPVLGGMSVQDAGGGVRVLSLPAQPGTAWLIQIATGNDATALAPLAITPVVEKVWIEGLPRNLSLAVDPGDGDSAIPIWSHPDLLLPESGAQPVSFLPIAQRILSKRLAVAAAGARSLTLPIKVHSDAACQLDLTAQTLTGEYQARPIAIDPLVIRVGGGWSPLRLSVPAGQRPARATADLEVELLGRTLNLGSPEPPVEAPARGLRVDPGRSVAVACAVAPRAGTGADDPVALASVRVLAAARADAEVVLELRGDVAGVPGALLVPPLPTRVAAGPADWIEILLPRPLPARPGGAPVWVALRATRGELLWFGGVPGGGGQVRFSVDKAATWAVPDAVIAPASGLWAQLFHVEPDPQPAPRLRLRAGTRTLSDDLLANAIRLGPTELRAAGAALPIAEVAAATIGAGRVETLLYLYAASAADITVRAAALAYDPFTAGGR